MADHLSKCPACNGRGYFRCACWPGDCICGQDDRDCDECGGEGIIDTSYDEPEGDLEYICDACASPGYGPDAKCSCITIKASETRIVFGLEAQGHIPAVEAALAEGADWQEIGRRIGWDGETAKAYYQRYLDRTAPTDTIGGDHAER